jgi:hypothetical protein
LIGLKAHIPRRTIPPYKTAFRPFNSKLDIGKYRSGMRSLSVAIFIAWAAVATQLIFLPPGVVERDLAAAREFLGNMKKAEPSFLEIPDVADQIRQAEQLVADPTIHIIVVWLKWIGLLFLVLFGFWGAYWLFRRLPNALLLVAIASFLFLTRQAVFSYVVYELLLQGGSPIPYLLKKGEYEFVGWMIWWDYILPLFFLSLVFVWLVHHIRHRPPAPNVV